LGKFQAAVDLDGQAEFARQVNRGQVRGVLEGFYIVPGSFVPPVMVLPVAVEPVGGFDRLGGMIGKVQGPSPGDPADFKGDGAVSRRVAKTVEKDRKVVVEFNR